MFISPTNTDVELTCFKDENLPLMTQIRFISIILHLIQVRIYLQPQQIRICGNQRLSAKTLRTASAKYAVNNILFIIQFPVLIHFRNCILCVFSCTTVSTTYYLLLQDRHTPKECLMLGPHPSVPEQCQSFRVAFFECKRSLVRECLASM